MKLNFLINIKKDNKIIGNCFCNEPLNTIEMLEVLRSMINNYNNRLSKSDLDNHEFMVRFFSEADKYGRDGLIGTGISKESFNYLTKKLKKENMDLSVSLDNRIISILPSHNELITTISHYCQAVIDFDERIIKLEVTAKLDNDEYKKKKNSSLVKITDLNLNKLHFYELEELISFLENTKDYGFIEKVDKTKVNLAFY